MKAMLLLGAASSFFVAFTSTASAQTAPSITSASVALTCRSALQGDQFTQVQGIASPPCCYVSIEEDWYKAKGVQLLSIYQRSNGDTYRAESCELISDNGKPVDLTTTGAIGVSGAPLANQPAALSAAKPAGATIGQALTTAGSTAGNTNSGHTGGNGSGQNGRGSNGGTSGGQNGGGHNGGDGNNGHGNDVGGVDPSNPGNSGGTANNGSNGGGSGNGNGNGGGNGNNGFGNGGGDGSPNGKQDETR